MSLVPIELISNLHVAQKKGKKQPQQETTQKHTRDELYKFSPKHKTVWKFSIQFYPISSKKSLSKTTMTTDWNIPILSSFLRKVNWIKPSDNHYWTRLLIPRAFSISKGKALGTRLCWTTIFRARVRLLRRVPPGSSSSSIAPLSSRTHPTARTSPAASQ